MGLLPPSSAWCTRSPATPDGDIRGCRVSNVDQ
nr:MAG TPA: hypothetical protein [Herelleviridae sp.]